MTATRTRKPRKTYRKRTSTKPRADVYELVTEKVTKALDKGVVPWRQPWNSSLGLPKSLSTGKPYRGVNILLLVMGAMEKGFTSPWWGTYKIIKAKGGQVRKGEQGEFVTFWNSYVKDEPDPDTGEIKKVRRFTLRYYKVFNSEQADWEDGKAPVVEKVQTRTPAERHDAAEKIIANYPNAPVIRRNGHAAFYLPSADTITVPSLESHDSAEAFYSTTFHEMAHSTGHKSRLDRDGVMRSDGFGRERYSKEELVAEFGATFLSGIAGIDQSQTIPNSAAYIANWLTALHDDRKLVVHAAAQAQHAADYILGTTFEDDDTEEAS